MMPNVDRPQTRRQLAFFFDQRGCIGCASCQVACKDHHDLPAGVSWRRVTTHEYGRFPHPEVFHLSISCNHCGKPACLEACPNGALAKRESDGVVVVDRELCDGCRACVGACPYGAPQYDERSGRVSLCDACVDLLAVGKQPACVTACVMRVLRVGWLNELAEGEVPRIRSLPDPEQTEPSLRVIPHRHASAPVATGATGNDRAEED